MILIPNGSSSNCMDSDGPSRANLVAWYGEFNGKDILPPKDVVFTIIPATSIILSNSVSKFVTIFVYHNSGKHTISESDNPVFL